MKRTKYILGSVAELKALYPAPKYANANLKFKSYADVISHWTTQSLAADGFRNASARAEKEDGYYLVHLDHKKSDHKRAKHFAKRHRKLIGPDVGHKAVAGERLLNELGVWNPMSGYPVNRNPSDGKCKWSLFPPLGLNIVGQKGVLLMHYPPWQVLQQGTFLDVMTMHRWSTVLHAAGVPKDEVSFYRTYVDVNPIAAPGSGQSEYPVDYFPIMMASGFFSGPPERDYIRSALDTYLNPPAHRSEKYTLPLLVCGSDLYDPQAPGWFRVSYKDDLPKNAAGTPGIDILQAGSIRVHDDCEKMTPYMGGNHMIAAGVTGRCTDDPSQKPDIRKYEAQDLVAASFLYAYAKNPDIDPEEAKRDACMRWFGNEDGSGAPLPPKKKDRLALCALAQMDLFFEPAPSPHPKYTYEQALKRCEEAGGDPCTGCIAPGTGGTKSKRRGKGCGCKKK